MYGENKTMARKRGGRMNVLVACEESQRVCMAFREKGHRAFSCDVIECSGDHPEWHIKQDVIPLLNGKCKFTTCDGKVHKIEDRWDMIIAHPPCTYLSTAATQCHSLKVKTLEQISERTLKRIESMRFFMTFINADCEKIVIENPQGVMSACYRKPDQYIHPYYFAKTVNDEDYVTKKTGLWLKGVKPLEYKCELANPMDTARCWKNGKKINWTEGSHSAKTRSKTFVSIAKAMAEQWG